LARSIGKSIVNSPLFQCAVCGNDPNVGRLVMAIGKHVGATRPDLDLSRTRLEMGDIEILANGTFHLSSEKEQGLIAHLTGAELYQSRISADGVYTPPIDFPPHERCVEIEVHLGLGSAGATVLGADRSHEYISENADYRS
jgi:glutamate N-acetyltransferase / amino-acid N-acetyltransferase